MKSGRLGIILLGKIKSINTEIQRTFPSLIVSLSCSVLQDIQDKQFCN